MMSGKRRSLLPRWFRALLVVSFGGMVAAGLLFRDGNRVAIARALFERVTAPSSPLLNAQAILGESRTESGKGSYYLNGMLVRYDSFGAPLGAGPTLIQIEQQLERAGYIHRVLPIQGMPTVVGIHPESLVMITARPGRDLRGQAAVRLSQQDLSQLDPAFEVELDDVAVYPGASDKILVQSAEGPPSTSLIYTAGGTVEDVRLFYLEEMQRLGWSPMEPPAPGAAGEMIRLLFFERGGVECSLVLVTTKDSRGTSVLATVSEGLGEES